MKLSMLLRTQDLTSHSIIHQTGKMFLMSTFHSHCDCNSCLTCMTNTYFNPPYILGLSDVFDFSMKLRSVSTSTSMRSNHLR